MQEKHSSQDQMSSINVVDLEELQDDLDLLGSMKRKVDLLTKALDYLHFPYNFLKVIKVF